MMKMEWPIKRKDSFQKMNVKTPEKRGKGEGKVERIKMCYVHDLLLMRNVISMHHEQVPKKKLNLKKNEV